MLKFKPGLALMIAGALSMWAFQSVKSPKAPLTLEVLYHPEQQVDFEGKPPRILEWLRDGQHYVEVRTDSQSKVQQLMRVEAATGISQPLFESEKIQRAFQRLPGISEKAAQDMTENGRFDFSPDEKAALIEYEGDIYYYRFGDDYAAQLTKTPVEEIEATFSPDGSRIAFIREFDVFAVDVASSTETQLTSGGNENLLNGRLDWVYQEEIYGRGHFKGFWWSPDSRRIAYLQLDESPVPRFTVIDHVPQHLKTEITRYPKAGDPNPLPRLGIVPAVGGEPSWIGLSGYAPEDLLIVRVGWTPNSREVVFQTQNKEQTWLDLNFADSASGQVRRHLRETTPAWVSVQGEPEWLEDGSFIWQSERSGWNHLYRYSTDGRLIGQVTSGIWEVSNYYGVDEAQKWVYFSGTERSSRDSDIYRVQIDGSRMERLSGPAGTHRARFNPQFSMYIDSWSDLVTPVQTRLHKANGEEILVIDSNSIAALEEFERSPIEFLQVPTRDGFLMEAMLIKPPDFDPTRKYPVMSHTYSGPHAPRVRNAWGGVTALWHQMLAQKGYIIWICDNRSASGKGAESTWAAYRNLGELELRDLEDGLAWLKQKPWVDGNRIGLWGWSYGGYMTSYALTHSTSFKVGIVGAPVTDWSLYDSVYTERYMGTPQNNPEGYRQSSVLEAAADLNGRMLLIHGTMDDNVHLQNSIKFIYELQKAGKQFDLMVYPKSRHGVRDPQLLYHLRALMTRFIEENL